MGGLGTGGASLHRAGAGGTVLLLAAALSSCAPESSPEPVLAAPSALEVIPAWTVTGEPMSVARQLTSATLLPGGGVLVAGGRQIGAVDTGDVVFQSAEVFDPIADGFVQLGDVMSTKRVRHTAVWLGARVLIAGGNGGPVATADLFDPQSGACKPTASLAYPRSGATSVALADGRALVVGGNDTTAAELFDPATETWSETGPMVLPRRLHAAARLLDGRVLVTGGQRVDDPSKATIAAEIYDPVAGTWKSAAQMGTPRLGHTATLLPDGRVLVAGGSTIENANAQGALSSAELYDPSSDSWADTGAMAVAHNFHTATALENGAVLVAGGLDETSSVLRATEMFDPDAQVWVPVGLMTHGRFQHVAALLADGAILVAGGEHQSSAEVYRPAQIGQGCAIGRQCASGSCVDGVCCDTACEGVCRTCALPGAEGTCSFAAPGTDPHLDCGAGGPCDDVCSGEGACADRVGEVCVEASCTDDRTAAVLPALCSVSGGECPLAVVECAPYRCGVTGSPPAAACLSACASIDDCAPGLACDPEGVCRLRPDVAAADPEACAASPGARPPRSFAALLAGLLLAAGALRLRRRPR